MEELYAFDYKLLYEKIKDYRYSQNILANKIPMSRTSLNQKLNGKGMFSQLEIKRISEILEIPPTKLGKYFFDENVHKTVQIS